ncbi:helix-turn-helix domain-containing protein [[Brevibacterium] frigoritolerans]|nr:helix-turn-helix domain-containing protein [Peribacillus frigoritolerans]
MNTYKALIEVTLDASTWDEANKQLKQKFHTGTNGYAIKSLEETVNLGIKTTPTRKGSSRKGKPLADTYHKTYSLYKQGFNIKQIAERRKLSEKTIENQLISLYVEGKDDVDITSLYRKGKEPLVLEVIRKKGTEDWIQLKKILPDEISFTEIKAIAAAHHLYHSRD